VSRLSRPDVSRHVSFPIQSSGAPDVGFLVNESKAGRHDAADRDRPVAELNGARSCSGSPQNRR